MWAEFDFGTGGDDRSFVLEPPFLRLQVVAGAGLLVFGHRFVLRLAAAACSGLGLWLALPKLAVSARWQRFAPKKRGALIVWSRSTAPRSLEVGKAGMRAYTA